VEGRTRGKGLIVRRKLDASIHLIGNKRDVARQLVKLRNVVLATQFDASGSQSLILQAPSGSAGRADCRAPEPTTARDFDHPIEHDRGEGDEKEID
jgi:hypothetical protein